MTFSDTLDGAINVVNERARAAAGKPADLDADGVLFAGDDADGFLRRLLSGTGIDPTDVKEFAVSNARQQSTAIQAVPSTAVFAVLEGYLVSSFLIGWHAHRLHDEQEQEAAA